MTTTLTNTSPFGVKPQPLEKFGARLQDICGSFELCPNPESPNSVSGHLSVAHLGGIDIARVALDADYVSRKSTNIRHDPGNHFFLILQQSGRSQLFQGDTTTWAKPGDMFIVDSTQESTFFYGGAQSLQLSIHLPREEMCHRFGQRIYGGIAIEGQDAMAIAMKAILAKLINMDDARILPHTVEAFYSVFGALLTERSLGNSGNLNPDWIIVQQALTLIAEHYRTPDFTSQVLADLTTVSLRRLQRAFKVTGETPHDRLQRFRIEAAHQALMAHPSNLARTSISTLAFDSGFGDLSTFYRLYRKYYGCAPGDTRQSLTFDV